MELSLFKFKSILAGLVTIWCTRFSTMDPWFWLGCQEASHF